MYRVQSILDKKIENNQVLYKIKWEKYPESQSTWQPIKNLKSVKSMITQFQAKYEKKNQSQNPKSKKNNNNIQLKFESRSLLRNRSKPHLQNMSQGQGRKMLKKSNADEKTQPNDKSSSLEEYYIIKQGKADDNQEMEELNLSFLSAKINELTRNKKSLKITDMFKGENNQFIFQVQRQGGKKTLQTRDYLLNNHYEDQMIEFYQSRIQFQRTSQ